MNLSAPLVLALPLLPLSAAAQSGYPNRPVKVIVSTVPGPLDTFARIVSESSRRR